MSGRAATPFFCPFCGDESLRPGEEHGTWTCESCTRGFALRSVRPTAPTAAAEGRGLR